MTLKYEIIEGILSYVIQNPDVTYDECVNLAVNHYSFTEDRAKFWIDLFLSAICSNLGIEISEDEAKNWISNQINNNVTIDQLCDKLIAMIAAVWNNDGEIIVTRDNQLYRKIQKYNILELEQLQERKEHLESEIDALTLDDSELLEWAKENHPQMLEVKQLQDELEQVIARIEELTNLME